MGAGAPNIYTLIILTIMLKQEQQWMNMEAKWQKPKKEDK